MNQHKSSLFFAILQDEARAIAQLFDATDKDSLARMLTRRIQARCQGERVYIPERGGGSAAEMREDIVRRHNGRNTNELAREYHITPRHVRRLASGK